MRYELGVLQLLVATASKRGVARVDVVAQAMGKEPAELESALRYLRTRGFVDAQWQPTDVGRARARFLQVRNSAAAMVPRSRKAPLPSRIPPSSGVYVRDAGGELVPAEIRRIGHLKTGS